MDYDAIHKAGELNPNIKKRKKRRTGRKAVLNSDLTLLQQKFVAAYVDPSDPKTFLCASHSVMKAGYNMHSNQIAAQYGHKLLGRPHIMKSIKDAFECDDINELIERGVKKRLQNPDTPYWQPTVDYVSKVRGDFAPEKHVNINLTPEQRDSKYNEILKLVEGKKKTLPNQPENTEDEDGTKSA